MSSMNYGSKTHMMKKHDFLVYAHELFFDYNISYSFSYTLGFFLQYQSFAFENL
jgi:hypothetical protein